ncbi:DoxX family membrane protein [Nocardia sp. NPDC050710]|uniref:DoxX family protein n=1 Tax=Nocardia sp. NPDC050710 TaxID=3157220 RepID=UPI0033BFC2F1
MRRLARPLLASAFVVGGIDTLLHPEQRVKAANALLEGRRGSGVDPATLVRVNAGVQCASGVLLATGKAPRVAALALAATVVPSTVTDQDFWAEQDPERRAAKRTAFVKDVSLLGGLLIASADTAGKPSLGWRGRRAARRAAAAVAAALPLGAAADGGTGDSVREHLHEAAVRGRGLAGVAATKGAEFAEVAQVNGAKLLDVAKVRAPEVAEVARERGVELAEIVKDRGPQLAEVARERGVELAEIVKDRGPQLAEVARERGVELAEIVRDRGPQLAEAAGMKARDWVRPYRNRSV